MAYTDIDIKEVKKLIKDACKIETVYIDKNYEVNYLPELLDQFYTISGNLLHLERQIKKIKLLLKYYYTGVISDKDLKTLGYTEKFNLLLDKKDVEVAIEVNEKFAEIKDKFEAEKSLLKMVETAINTFKFRGSDIKNIITYRQMTGG
jgi:hypothetical protein